MYVFKRTGSTGTTSKYWSVKFRGHDGHQILRTTRCENKQEAVVIGTKWERAARLAANGEFTQAASITFFNELLRATTAEELNVPRVEARFLPGCTGNSRQSDCTALPVVARQTVRMSRRPFKRVQPPNAGFADTRSGRPEEGRQRTPVSGARLPFPKTQLCIATGKRRG
jgi:hypothetical protein